MGELVFREERGVVNSDLKAVVGWNRRFSSNLVEEREWLKAQDN